MINAHSLKSNTPDSQCSVSVSLPLPCHDLTFCSQADWSCVQRGRKLPPSVHHLYSRVNLYYAWLLYTPIHSADAWPDATVLTTIADCKRSEVRHPESSDGVSILKNWQSAARLCVKRDFYRGRFFFFVFFFSCQCDDGGLEGCFCCFMCRAGIIILFFIINSYANYFNRQDCACWGINKCSSGLCHCNCLKKTKQKNKKRETYISK